MVLCCRIIETLNSKSKEWKETKNIKIPQTAIIHPRLNLLFMKNLYKYENVSNF